MELTIQEANVSKQTTLAAEADDVRYVAAVTEVDGQITSARCSVNVKELIDDDKGYTYSYIGTIIYASNSITTQQLPLTDAAKYVAAFSEMLEQYKKGGAGQ